MTDAQQPAESRHVDVRVWRGAHEGCYRHYQVPRRTRQTVLDLVTWIQRHAAADLSYRFSCRVGMCGSCAMNVNGRPTWTCRTLVSEVEGADGVVVAPLANLPVVKDLVVDMSPFFDRWRRVAPPFESALDRTDEPVRVDPASEQRRAADAGIECINCAVCFAACDVVGWNPAYAGPAALNRAWTLANDERFHRPTAVMAAVASDGGCMSCHTQASCTQACPVGLDPSASIAGLKRRALRAWRRGDIQ